jgi:hypothetical protein
MKVIWQPKALKQLKKIGNRIIQSRILDATRGKEVSIVSIEEVKKRNEHTY